MIKKASGGTFKNENTSIKELSKELQNPIIKKFNKTKVQSPFVDNIWDADLADMQLINRDFYYVFLLLITNMHGSFL